MSYTYGLLYLSRSINTRLDQRVSEPLMYTQFVEIVDSGKVYFNSRSLWKSSRADLGVGRGGVATPFSLKFCFIFIEFSEN